MSSAVADSAQAESKGHQSPSATASRRGGYARRGGHRGGAGGARGSKNDVPQDESEVARQLRSKYPSQLNQLKVLFPDWTDEELLFVLQDAAGEVELAVGLISEGQSQHSKRAQTTQADRR